MKTEHILHARTHNSPLGPLVLAASARGLAELVQWYAQGKVKPAIEQRLPMRELPAAFARMASRQVQGKLLLVNA